MTAQTDTPVPPLLDPYDYDFHEDPYPYYRRLRDEAPLYHNQELGFWALSRHHDVLQGFRNSTTLSNRDGVSLDPVSRGPHASKTMSFLAMDDPAHLRLRTLVSKGFTPRRIRELEPRVTELAVQHLDTMLEKAASGPTSSGTSSATDSETVDYVAEFAGKLPMDVISELMGVPVADRDRIRAMADGVMHREDGVTDVPAAAIEASLNLIVYYQQMIAERRKKPTEDLTSALLEAEIDGDRLADEEILGFMFLMVIAGNETTTKLLANAAFWGHKNPDQLAPVYTNLSLVPLWVEETLRYDTSSQILARTVSGNLNLYNTTIPEGDVLLLLPGSAHRDERVFDKPDDYLIGREIGAKLLSFGSGSHFCLGAHLARMEARVALAELFKRIRGYQVDEANAVRVHSSNVRGFAQLPMTVEVA
jgi:cytochrome P450